MADTKAGTAPASRAAHSRGRGTPAAAPSGPQPHAIVETRVLRGPNYWAREPVIRLLVDLGVLEQYPSNLLPNFTDALVALLPTLEDHACSLGRRGGLITRLREGTSVGHIAEHVALEFQNLAGTDVRHGKTRGAGKVGQYNWHLRVPRGGRRAGGRPDGRRAGRSPRRAGRPRPLLRLRTRARAAHPPGRAPGVRAVHPGASSTRRSAATSRSSGSTGTRWVQFGHGVHQQRVRATMTSLTSAIGVDVASDKSLTNRLLDSAGLPVPRADVVDTEDGAVAAAKRLGYPCVVKPLDGNHGRGVHLDLRSEDAVRAAFHGALAQSRGGDVVIETYVAGNDYRCLVIGGKVAAIAERVPASVTGDGEHTVRQLVDIANSDPRRGIGHEKVLTRIKVDEAAEALVRDQGYGLDDVLAAGVRVKLALTGNMSTGGTSIDRTIEAHPDNVEIARDGRPDRRPGRGRHRLHLPRHRDTGPGDGRRDRRGQRRARLPDAHQPDRGRAPVRRATGHHSLFPAGVSARIPIIAVTGTNGKTTTVRMIAHILKLMGRRVGMTSTDGIVIDGRLIKKGDMSGPKSALMVLQNPTVDTAVFEVARGGILREGLGYDRNDVAVVTNVTGDHLGLGGIDSIGQLANVKGVVVEAVPRSGTAVLNADDHLVYRMGRHCAGRVVLFSMATAKGEDGFDRVDGHTSRGGAAFTLETSAEGELIVLRLGSRTMPILYTHLVPATFGGRARMNVANALAAAAAAWAAGAHLHDIRQGLRTFSTSFFQAPGRLNLVDVGGVRVVIDYCHNVDGMRQLADFVGRMMVDTQTRPGRLGTGSAATRSGRAIGVLGIPATGATKISASTAPSPRAPSTRSSSGRTRTCAAGRRGRRPPTSSTASVAPRPPAAPAPAAPRRCSTRWPPFGRAARTISAISWCAASTTRSGSIGKRPPPPGHRAAGRPSPTRVNWPRRRDDPRPMSETPWVMRMRWLDLLFAHWPVRGRDAATAHPGRAGCRHVRGLRVAGHRAVPDGGRRTAVPAGRAGVRAPSPS